MFKILPGIFFLGLLMTSCVSQSPQYSSIQDGVRCPLPTKNIVSNKDKNKRTPASLNQKSNDQICETLFAK